MRKEEFEITNEDLSLIKEQYPNLGKNSHVGSHGVAIAIKYLKRISAEDIRIPSSGADIQAKLDGVNIQYEVKATVDNKISFYKLKVSSDRSHDLLKGGMELMRICKVGQAVVDIYFLKYGEDFELLHEPRYRVKRIKSN